MIGPSSSPSSASRSNGASLARRRRYSSLVHCMPRPTKSVESTAPGAWNATAAAATHAHCRGGSSTVSTKLMTRYSARLAEPTSAPRASSDHVQSRSTRATRWIAPSPNRIASSEARSRHSFHNASASAVRWAERRRPSGDRHCSSSIASWPATPRGNESVPREPMGSMSRPSSDCSSSTPRCSTYDGRARSAAASKRACGGTESAIVSGVNVAPRTPCARSTNCACRSSSPMSWAMVSSVRNACTMPRASAGTARRATPAGGGPATWCAGAPGCR